jgi:hypothetical protein
MNDLRTHMKRLVKPLQVVRRSFGGSGRDWGWFAGAVLGRQGCAHAPIGAGSVRPAGPGQGARKRSRSNAASLRLSGVRQPVVDHFWVTCCGHRAGMAELL